MAMIIKTTTQKQHPHVYNSNYYLKIQKWNYINETLPHIHHSTQHTIHYSAGKNDITIAMSLA